MTRLIADWLIDLKADMAEQEKRLKERTGLDYLSLAANASNMSCEELQDAAPKIKVAVIPVTTGLGIIGSFSETVAAVVRTMGFQAFVTAQTDVAGIREAYLREADILYLADDDCFLAMNLHQNRIVDNNPATAAGYVAALEGMCGSLTGKEVLLLGCGALGKALLPILCKKGATVTVYDKDPMKIRGMEQENVADFFMILKDSGDILEYSVVVDATSEGDWLHVDMLHRDLCMVAPGVPLSLDEEAFRVHADKVVHDCLQIGVAAMLGLSLSNPNIQTNYQKRQDTF